MKFRYLLLAFVLMLLAGGIAGGLWVKGKLDARRERLARYEAAEKEKAKSIKLTFIEGWTEKQYAQYIEKQGVMKADVFLKAARDFNKTSYPALSTIPKGYGLEGFLFPDTYQLPENPPADLIIDTLVKTFAQRIQKLGAEFVEGRVVIPGYENLPEKTLSLYQVVTLASVVEKETGQDLTNASANQKDRLLEERKIVAGIFYNRLVQGGRLESDATVNYVTGKSRAQSTLEDTKINSPYNTYMYPGLPPGPIASPSLQSLQAVLQPTKTDYYYFLHKQPSGEVVYSKTYDEHVRNKQKYLK